MKSAGKARNNGLYRHIRTSKEIIRNLLNDYNINTTFVLKKQAKSNPLEFYLSIIKTYLCIFVQPAICCGQAFLGSFQC